jgi:nicotinate phosphoribosyltransferase
MQNAVLKLFPDSQSEYKFTNRAPDMLFSRSCHSWVQRQVNGKSSAISTIYLAVIILILHIAKPALSTLRLTPAEREYLENNCLYFDTEYLDFLEKLQLDPANQVQVTFVPQSNSENLAPVAKRQKLDRSEQSGPDETNEADDPDEKGLIEMKIQGPWRECILYEVPLMSIRKSTNRHCFGGSLLTLLIVNE